MAWNVKFDDRGLKESFQKIRQLDLKKLGAWDSALPAAKVALIDNFQVEGYREGTKGAWKPLEEKYARWKLKKYGPKPVMQASGKLMADLLKMKNKQTKNTLVIYWKAMAKDFNYAAFHQREYNAPPIFSTKHGGRPVTFTPKHVQMIIKPILDKVLRETGLR